PGRNSIAICYAGSWDGASFVTTGVPILQPDQPDETGPSAVLSTDQAILFFAQKPTGLKSRIGAAGAPWASLKRPFDLPIWLCYGRCDAQPSARGNRASRRSAMRVRFWGVRGSLPSPGVHTNRYGGNTSCVEVRIGDQGPRIIIDAGTGIRKLGKDMANAEFGQGQGAAHLLISHTHWDHIQGLPFFSPLYHKGNRIFVYARQRDDTHLRAVFQSQTEDPYFPVPFDSVQADVALRELIEGARFEIGPVKVSCTRLNHPWIAMAYRLDYEGHSLAYVTDTAPFRDILFEHEFIQSPPEPGAPMRPDDARKLKVMRDGVVKLCEGADLV